MESAEVFATVANLPRGESVLFKTDGHILEVRRASDYTGYHWVTVASPTKSGMTCIQCISGECTDDHEEYDIHVHYVNAVSLSRYELVHELRNPVSGFVNKMPVQDRMTFSSAREWIADYVTKYVK